MSDTAHEPLLPAGTTPRLNVWFEINGQVVLSLWRIRLLEAIGATGSISSGARKMDIQYRRAWDKIQEMEAALGHRLVHTQIGGEHGGGAELTDYAHQLIERFRACTAGLVEQFMAQVGEQFPELSAHNK
jgi:molybdate transport system regulatory protein